MLSLNADPIAMAVLGLGGILLGMVELALSRVRRFPTWSVSLALVALLALTGGAAFACGEASMFWQPPLVLAGVALMMLLFRSPTSIAGRPVVQGAGLVLLSGVLLTTQLYRFECEVDNELVQSDAELAQMCDPIDKDSPPALVSVTDAGQSIPLFHVSADVGGVTPAQETRYLNSLSLHAKIIQTGAPDLRYNCHGWVFADGRYWVRSRFVDSILKDNAYRVVEHPRPGDVAVFRNQMGEVTHSGLVRAGETDGQVLIESKWGRFGRYVHTLEDHGYRNDKASYYRTSRGTHLLKGTEYPKPANAAAGG